MVADQNKYNQVNNIIRRSQALILNVKLLGADTSNAKQLLDSAKVALDNGDYNSAINYAKKSMVEVIELKKKVKKGKIDDTLPQKSKPNQISELEQDKIDHEPEELEHTYGKKVKLSAIEKTPDAEKTKFTEHKKTYDIEEFEEGFSYLIEETRANLCFKILSEYVSLGYKGLCICRTNPSVIRRKYDLDESSTVLWLTDRESSTEATISPSLESMIYVAEEFIDKNEKGIVLLDGLEYLISNNSFNPVLRFIRRLIDRISETNSLFLIAVSPKAINEQELKLLERELQPVTFY